MTTNKNKKIKRIKPKSVTVYFVGENEKFLQDLEKLAKDIDQPISKVCVGLLKLGMPMMQHYAEALKEPGKRLVTNTTIKLTDEGGIFELVTQQEAAH